MDIIYKLTKEKKALEQKKKDLELQIEQNNLQYRSNIENIAQAYQNFYDKKTNKEFVLYERYPSIESLKLYLREISWRFPLYDFGVLNVKELVEIIKHIYQFKTGKEFEILTIGATEKHGIVFNYSMQPHVYFLVGTEKSLGSFKKYNGMYVNSDRFYRDIYLYTYMFGYGKNLINIEIDSDHGNSLGIECLTGSLFDKKGKINYSDDQGTFYDTFDGSINKQIFSGNIISKLDDSDFKGIKDVLDFDVHPFDTYIAKILISIVIYKRNNQIQQLTEKDYNHIFDVLFGEKVTILEDVEKDIPRQLIYVPGKSNR